MLLRAVTWPFLLSVVILLTPASATVYSCWPIDVTGRCLGPTDDIVRVQELDVKNMGNGEIIIDVTLRNVVINTVEADYILQVRDEEGRNVYLDWKAEPIADGAAAYMSSRVELAQEKYSIKVMVWSNLDEAPGLLLYSPVEQSINLSA